jgi:hypothetical protein
MDFASLRNCLLRIAHKEEVDIRLGCTNASDGLSDDRLIIDE